MTIRYVLKPTATYGEWLVTVDVPPPVMFDIVFHGTAQECIDWCLDQRAERIGPRVFVKQNG